MLISAALDSRKKVEVNLISKFSLTIQDYIGIFVTKINYACLES